MLLTICARRASMNFNNKSVDIKKHLLVINVLTPIPQMTGICTLTISSRFKWCKCCLHICQSFSSLDPIGFNPTTSQIQYGLFRIYPLWVFKLVSAYKSKTTNLVQGPLSSCRKNFKNVYKIIYLSTYISRNACLYYCW